MKPWHTIWDEATQGKPRVGVVGVDDSRCVCGAGRDISSHPLRGAVRDHPTASGEIVGYLTLFARGFLLVFLVSTNTYQIAHQHFIGATLVGFMISLTWFYNARKAARSDLWGAGVVYALGAAAGTLIGLTLMTSLWGK
jgi:hypothetical protein